MEHQSRAVDVYVAEYQRAYTEIFSRFESQRLAFTVLVGASAGVFAIDKAFVNARLGEEICCWAPLVIAPLGYIFFDNELQIWRIAGYLRENLRPRLAALTEDADVLGLDSGRIASKLTSGTAVMLSFGRWLFFLVPAIAAIAAAAPLFGTGGYHTLLAIVDFAAVALLVLGIVVAARVQVAWVAQKRDPLKP